MSKPDIEHKHLIDWLRDAHAMERTAEKMLEKQVERLDDYPDVRHRVEEHLVETRAQAERVERCLEHLGSDTSTTKDLMGRLISAVGSMNAAASDEPVKHHISSYTLEQQEIICYRSLIAAAEQLGETEVAAACRENLAEEEAMAEWLGERIEVMTLEFLQRERASHAA